MKRSILKILAAIAFTLTLDMAAFGHTTVESATPKSGAVLQASPASIAIEFHSAAQLTSAAVVSAGKSERRLQFKAGDKVNSFELLEPKLEVGRNEIQWKALSKDGHVISGSLIYTLQAPGAK